MDFDAVVLLVILIGLFVNFPNYRPSVSWHWLTHMSSADQASVPTPQHSRWARR